MKTVGAYDAKAHFSEILEAIHSGESYIITKHGKQVAEMHPCKKRKKRKRGSLKHFFGVLSEDFNSPLEDFKDYQ